MIEIDLGDRRQRADQLVADFEDLLLQIKGDFRSKDETLHSATPVGVQLESLPMDFSYSKLLISTRRKIDALHELIRQMKEELGALLLEDLNKDSVVLGKSCSLER